MLRIRGPAEVGRIVDTKVRSLVEERFAQVLDGEAYDADVHGEMIVVEPGDTLASLEKESGLPVAVNPVDESRWPDAEFMPICEHLEEHAGAYEMTFIFTDDGAGTILFIPRRQGVDADLLALCERFAEPAFDPAAR